MKDLLMRYLEEIVGKKRSKQFMHWAFGPLWKELDINLEMMKSWNYLHRDILILEPDDKFREDMDKMIELWKKHDILAKKNQT